MSDLFGRAVLTGILFSIWSIFLKRSGLGEGNLPVLVAIGVAFLVVLPSGLQQGLKPFAHSAPTYFILAGLTLGCGFIAWNGVVGRSTEKQLGSLFLVMVLSQMVVPALYDMYQNQAIAPKKVVGLVLAAAATALLR